MDTLTPEPRPNPPTLFVQIFRSLPAVLLIAGVIGLLYSPLSWLTGGFRPQTQIDVETLKAQSSDLRSQVAVCNSRLDAMPRSSDFAGWEAHLSRLDARLDALGDAQAQDRLTNKETAVRVQNLTALGGRR